MNDINISCAGPRLAPPAEVEATSNADGRFTLTLGDGQAYRLSTWLDAGGAQVDIVVARGMQVELVLRRR